MVQVLVTIFFSAAALGALSVIVAMIVDNVGDVGTALGFVRPLPQLPSPRVRVRRVDAVRTPAAQPVPPRRAAA